MLVNSLISGAQCLLPEVRPASLAIVSFIGTGSNPNGPFCDPRGPFSNPYVAENDPRDKSSPNIGLLTAKSSLTGFTATVGVGVAAAWSRPKIEFCLSLMLTEAMVGDLSSRLTKN